MVVLDACVLLLLLPRRDAFVLARMTGRTLVMPTVVCYCEWDEVPRVLDNCRVWCAHLPMFRAHERA